ncbi:hypothetical protein EI200_04505 [Peribacillus simplex]|uniref:hypothetical protein n=1 Tax=Peribacillus simplex TaxID=1478 RepID=UPI000F6370EE|nr:hypothetical protein [Peribacillus simplex]RRN73946.1 hypothetical protein EI200_04505 [Peribacillus simplex]
MKNILSVALLSVGLLSACQAQSTDTAKMEPDEQGLVQVRMAVESEEINTVLKQLHEEGKEIIEVKPLDQKEVTGYVDRVYDIIYEDKK